MRFAYDDEQRALQASARRFLADVATPERVLALGETEAGFDRASWRRMAEELGWTALVIPEDRGGFGLGAVELTALCEELGRVVMPSPYLHSAVHASSLLVEGGVDRDLLPRLAAGDAIATVAADTPVTAAPSPSGWRLDGTLPRVPWAHVADALLVAAHTPDGALAVFAVDASRTAVTVRPTLDATQRLADVALSGLDVREGARIADSAALARARDLTAIARAAEQTGGAAACLEMAVEYARTREQFGRPIGSFQAIKHTCADMMVHVESARSAAMWAGWVAAHAPDDLPEAVAVARATCGEAYWFCAAENIQVHGGIGFTWEHPAHLHLKRARATAALDGGAAAAREAVAARLLA